MSIICISEAILALVFIGLDYLSVILIMCELIIAASWVGCALTIHREVWHVEEWPGDGVKAFFFANVFINLLQIVYIVAADTVFAVPVLSLLAAAGGLGIAYLKKMAYQPSELDRISLDRVSVGINDSHPLAPPTSLSFKEGLLDPKEEKTIRKNSDILSKLFAWGNGKKEENIQHNRFHFDYDPVSVNDLEGSFSHGESFSSTKSIEGSSSPGTDSNTSSGAYDSNLGTVRSTFERSPDMAHEEGEAPDMYES